MNTKHCLISILSSIALVACFAGVGPDAHGQGITVRTYELTNLGAFPDQKVAFSTATAINSAGEVTGISGRFGFCYDRTEKEPMEKLGGSQAGAVSRAFAMNDYDQVVGDSMFGGKNSLSQAALFYKGSVILLGVLNNPSLRNYSRATGINSAGQVVGFSGPTLEGINSRAFIWSKASGMSDIGTLGGAYAQASAINDSGLVTGNSQLRGKAGSVHAFIYDSLGFHIGPIGMRDLGTLGGSYSYGTFINGKNNVVGYSTVDKWDNRIHAFLYSGGKMRDLGSLGRTLKSDQSFALGVNNDSDVVGYTYLGPGPGDNSDLALKQVAFLVTKGVMVNLNDLIGGAAKSYWLQSAVAINNKGEIAATAIEYSTGYVCAVLLTPTGISIGVDTD